MRRNIFVTIGDLAARLSFLAIFAQLIDWGSQKYTKNCTALVEKGGCYPLPTKYIHIKSTTVYVLSLELGLSHPLSRQRVCPSPRNQRVGGHRSVRVRVWGSPNPNDWRKSLELCLYSVPLYPFLHPVTSKIMYNEKCMEWKIRVGSQNCLYKNFLASMQPMFTVTVSTK